MKLHLLLPKKWKTLDKRIEALSTYLSRKDRLGTIYGDIKITYDIVTLPELTLNLQGVYNKNDILNITKKYHNTHDAVGIVFSFVKGEKYAGNYYPNDNTEYKMDFYIKADEKTRQASGFYFEEFIEHEIAGHAVALDLGLSNQGTGLTYVAGADNTHYYFYNNKKDEYYKEINDLWNKKRSIFLQIIEAGQKIVDNLLKKKQIPKDNRLEGLTPRTRELAEALITVCFKAGKEIRVTEGYRSCDMQNMLYAQGRTTAGQIVTNAKCGQSNHQKGTAFDIVFRKGGYDVPESQWQWVGAEAKKLGLKWGGDWKGKFVDRPHFEL